MSLWPVFIAVGALGVALSLGAAVWRPRERETSPAADGPLEPRVEGNGDIDREAEMQRRVDALEADVDDLTRAVATLREENEYLMQRIDGVPTGERPNGVDS